ncbi:MAG: hypothetical protein OFPI_36080 [Osedax symbiont Rs2]|nr:MAG: hypothetical protein OFPI_36080 [Osedax symbiont Rs2]
MSSNKEWQNSSCIWLYIQLEFTNKFNLWLQAETGKFWNRYEV